MDAGSVRPDSSAQIAPKKVGSDRNGLEANRHFTRESQEDRQNVGCALPARYGHLSPRHQAIQPGANRPACVSSTATRSRGSHAGEQSDPIGEWPAQNAHGGLRVGIVVAVVATRSGQPTSRAFSAATTASGDRGRRGPIHDQADDARRVLRLAPLQLYRDEDVAGKQQGRLDHLAAVDNAPIAEAGRVGLEAKELKAMQCELITLWL